ncbi:hypothetical protein Ocin01_19484 [Orchesella cincta]|uniref:Uncharacterized protein n=1 Tax=Orchesella cincta TaxID=48709 RepID=A0A1D2M2J9_ORCCI|nr:hypothetical protein Ocin01_19484 [Orchesella cincta]
MASKIDHPNSDLNDLLGYLSPTLYDDTLKQLRELEKLGKLEITGNKDELEEMQRVELAKAFPVPPDYPKIRTICDCDTNGGYAAKTTNRASSIFLCPGLSTIQKRSHEQENGKPGETTLS